MRPALVRALSLDVLSRVFDGGELADRALDRAIRANPSLHSTERRLVGEAVFAVLRHATKLDAMADVALKAARRPSVDQLSSPERLRWRLALALATELGQPATEAARTAGLEPSLEPFLAKASVAVPVWPADPDEALAVRHSVPRWFAARVRAGYGEGADALLAALASRAPLTLRTNLLKGGRDALVEALAQEGVTARPCSLSPWAVTLEGRPNIFGLKAYQKGLFEVQDEGSQLIALVTGAKSGRTIVDACAGGGGKTLALGAMMQNKGRLVACDVSEARLKDLAPRMKRAGVYCVEPRVVSAAADGAAALENLHYRADVVLVDAPCSGTGSWRRNADARWRLTEAEADAYPEKQLAILRRYARLLKPGGLLVYATCSILPSENQEVVAAFTADGKFEVTPAPVPESARDARGNLAVLPHVHGTDGFFASVMRRVG